MVASRETPRGQICLQEANSFGSRKENLFQRKPERVDFVPRRSVASGTSRKKNGEATNGKYW
jgi:hypothetical protein